ncbi:hypothetical protein L6164_027387 [Bauhinia variegata]|uniref:Uncharacterized protein n=1 Tax=Bauhinia variegata TaxID=167791 RepID=A0ACB9LT75_BAUVA|nr:hypothetical protein L6164_027387 [Bauhinia variegata]
MAVCLDEEQVWKCPKHPSKRRRSGICPICLRDRLVTLCPDCANVRPCSCCATSTSSSSSSSSSFSRFSVAVDGDGDGVRVHNLIDGEPPLRRSRSTAIPFLQSRSRFSGGGKVLDPDSRKNSPALNRSKPTKSLWSLFKLQKSSSNGVQEQYTKVFVEDDGDVSKVPSMMMRSRSVAVASVPGSGTGEMRTAAKGRGYWFLSSPIKAFRQPKASKMVREWSPLYRG